MKHIWKVAAIGLVAAAAFLIISFLVRIVVTLLAIGLLARLIYGLGRHAYFGSGRRHDHRESFSGHDNYGMNDAGAVSIDADWYRPRMQQTRREQKITVL